MTEFISSPGRPEVQNQGPPASASFWGSWAPWVCGLSPPPLLHLPMASLPGNLLALLRMAGTGLGATGAPGCPPLRILSHICKEVFQTRSHAQGPDRAGPCKATDGSMKDTPGSGLSLSPPETPFFPLSPGSLGISLVVLWHQGFTTACRSPPCLGPGLPAAQQPGGHRAPGRLRSSCCCFFQEFHLPFPPGLW